MPAEDIMVICQGSFERCHQYRFRYHEPIVEEGEELRDDQEVQAELQIRRRP